MSSESRESEALLENHREYLGILARLQLEQGLHAKIDLSGVVQQTMLEAYQALSGRERESRDQLAGWLRRILANNLADEIRKLKAGKRDVARERSLDAALEQSSLRIEAWLAAEQSSPSLRARREERAVLLCAALGQLSDAQREALVLRHLRDQSLAQIAETLGRSPPAVAGLLKRGLQRLRDLLKDVE